MEWQDQNRSKMFIRRRGKGNEVVTERKRESSDSTSNNVSSSPEKKTGVIGKIVQGAGAFIQGAVIASDKSLDFAQATKEKSSHGSLSGGNRRRKQKQRNERKQRSVRNLFDSNNSHFSEEQKKELSSLLEKHFDEMERDEYEDMTDEQDDDDGYFGITDPGLTAPTMTMGIRNSFGDFFGNSADAMEAHSKESRSERKNSIYR